MASYKVKEAGNPAFFKKVGNGDKPTDGSG